VPEYYRYPFGKLLVEYAVQVVEFLLTSKSQVSQPLSTEPQRKVRDEVMSFDSILSAIKEAKGLIEELSRESAPEDAARALEALTAMPPGALHVSANATAIAGWAETIMVYVLSFAVWTDLGARIKEVQRLIIKEGKGDANLVRELDESGDAC